MGPESGQIREWFQLGVTIVDSLDTLLLLGLDEEFQEARKWVANHLDMEGRRVSVGVGARLKAGHRGQEGREGGVGGCARRGRVGTEASNKEGG